MSSATFIKQAIFARKTTGAIVESSKTLSKAMIDYSNIKNSDVIVELGPGTGVITEHITERLPASSTFFALELNEDLAKKAQLRCPKALIYNDCATKLNDYLIKHEKENCDTIISGLPWASFNEELQEKLLSTITSSLKPGGEFITFAYFGVHKLSGGQRLYKMLNSKFKTVNKSKPIWRNIPPAFIYHCKV